MNDPEAWLNPANLTDDQSKMVLGLIRIMRQAPDTLMRIPDPKSNLYGQMAEIERIPEEVGWTYPDNCVGIERFSKEAMLSMPDLIRAGWFEVYDHAETAPEPCAIRDDDGELIDYRPVFVRPSPAAWEAFADTE